MAFVFQQKTKIIFFSLEKTVYFIRFRNAAQSTR